jgi:hypothetical protein
MPVDIALVMARHRARLIASEDVPSGTGGRGRQVVVVHHVVRGGSGDRCDDWRRSSWSWAFTTTASLGGRLWRRSLGRHFSLFLSRDGESSVVGGAECKRDEKGTKAPEANKIVLEDCKFGRDAGLSVKYQTGLGSAS